MLRVRACRPCLLCFILFVCAGCVTVPLMALAGYDPRSAVPFWERMAHAHPNNSPAFKRFLATHPLPEARIEGIRSHLPEALAIYEK